MVDDYYVINIHEFLDNIESGEDELHQILSGFFCNKNTDVESFFRNESIEFAKKSQSVTYLVFSRIDSSLVGYYSIAIKPISIRANVISNTSKRKIERVGKFDENTGMYVLSAFLIAQLGKNFSGHSTVIRGDELLQLAVDTVKDIKRMAGGTVVFLEAENNNKLLEFYRNNCFKEFNVRAVEKNNGYDHTLVQLLRIV